MKVRCIPLIALLGAVTAAPARAQDEDMVPIITAVYGDVYRNLGNGPFGPLLGPEAYSAENPPLEWDVLVLTFVVVDNGLPEDEVFSRKQFHWVPYDSYYAPEPPPVEFDSENFIPPPIIVEIGVGTATYQYAMFMPELNGQNQAKLRGLINYDVRFRVTLDVANTEEPQPGEWTGVSFDILMNEDPEQRPPNPPPAADAGADQLVEVNATVRLDGRRTFDGTNVGFDPQDPNVYEKDRLTFTWEWLDGPVRVDPGYPDPEGQPAIAEATLSTVGTYIYRLLVEDNSSSELPSTDTVTIEVVASIPENRPPRAEILGPAGTAPTGSVISLDGTLSNDPDGDPLGYRWRQTDELGGNLAPDSELVFQPLSGLEAPVLTFQANTPGTYYFRLLVSDGELTDTARVSVEVAESQTAGLTVVNPNPIPFSQTGGSEGSDGSSGDEDAAPSNNRLGACGAGILPFGLLPLAWCALRRRAR